MSLYENETTTAIILSVIIVIITLVLFFILKAFRVKRSGLLLMGINDAGKTTMFLDLIHNNNNIQTVTSVKENEGVLIFGNKSLNVFDLPGYERIRMQFIDKFKHTVKAIIFVIDSVTLQKDVKDVAEFLYDILTDNIIIKYSPPILIACNKQDCTMAKGANIIKSLIQKELNTLRTTKSAALQSTDETTKRSILGNKAKDFEFSDLKMKVDFIECAARNNDNISDLDNVKLWLKNIAS